MEWYQIFFLQHWHASTRRCNMYDMIPKHEQVDFCPEHPSRNERSTVYVDKHLTVTNIRKPKNIINVPLQTDSTSLRCAVARGRYAQTPKTEIREKSQKSKAFLNINRACFLIHCSCSSPTT